jgi:signal transduction histidine kinase
MINDLLEANRIEAGQKLLICPKLCDLRKIVIDTCDQLKSVYGDSFVLKLPEKEVIGKWSQHVLQRALENLAINAYKYGDHSDPITILLRETSAAAFLSVHNFGNPISAEDQQDIFKRYYRTQSAQRSGKAGWGVGLILVRGVAEAHGGIVHLESSQGNGTLFTIELPK